MVALSGQVAGAPPAAQVTLQPPWAQETAQLPRHVTSHDEKLLQVTWLASPTSAEQALVL
jgi:hypothetical protein